MSKNRPYFGVYGFFWMAYAMFLPYLGLIYEQKGLTGMQIGGLSVLEAVAVPAAGLAGGALLARMRRPVRMLALLPALCIAAAVGIYFSAGIALIALTSGLLYFFQTPVNDAADSLLIRQLKDRPERFSLYRLGGSVGYGVGAMAAGWLCVRFGYISLYAAYGAAMLAMLVSALLLPSPETPAAGREKKRADLACIKLNSRFLYIYGTMLIFGILDSGFGKFMALHIVGQGLSASFTGYMIAAAMVGEVAVFLCYPSLLRDTSPGFRMLLGFAFEMLRLCALAFIAVLPLSVTLGCQALGGGAFAVIYTTVTGLIDKTYPREAGFAAQALKNVVRNGMGYVAGSLAFGWVYERLSLGFGYKMLASLAAVCTLMYLILFIIGARRAKN